MGETLGMTDGTNEDDRRRVRVIVSGVVQGVFYRTSCAGEARRAGVGGFVRNLADGSVEAAFEGPAREVDGMVRWCRSGSRGASVERVRLFQEELTGERSFRILG
jgi:acylphosphatase